MALLIAATAAHSATPVGVFEDHADINQPAKPGSALYDERSQTYQLTGAGTNMWFGADQFHFAWKRLRGDFILRAHATFPAQGVDPHRKLGWMIRTSLAADSPHASGVVHGDGLTSLQFRRTPGGPTEEIRSAITGADVVQLERKGSEVIFSAARFGDPFATVTLTNIQLGAEMFAGLFVCSHNPDVAEQATFTNVRVILPAADNFVPYRDYIGSNLEILDVSTGHRQIVHQSPDSIQAPNWTPDGQSLLFNSKGRMFRFDLAQRTVAPLDTGFADRNNNDHVLSFDGTQLGISHHSTEAGGGSLVYVLPAGGGVPRQVTSLAPSYLHGWTPDGRHLLYTGERNGEFDIYRISVDGGPETRLTSTPGLDDGSEYSPDGRFIYFNSSRSGSMQLWRMKPDGSEPEQLTRDDFNNWFPHISPDGASIAFLSFPASVKPDDHPFYQRVYLRLMPVAGGPARVIAYVYGGQGTINVPSWAPDSRRLAFVSNTRL